MDLYLLKRRPPASGILGSKLTIRRQEPGWMRRPPTLVADHISSGADDSRLQGVRVPCHPCHRQTEHGARAELRTAAGRTFGGRLTVDRQTLDLIVEVRFLPPDPSRTAAARLPRYAAALSLLPPRAGDGRAPAPHTQLTRFVTAAGRRAGPQYMTGPFMSPITMPPPAVP